MRTERHGGKEVGNHHYLLDSRGTLGLKFWRGASLPLQMLLLFYSLPSRLISFLLSFWHLLPLPNILQCQSLLGCFLTLYLPWAPAGEGVGSWHWGHSPCSQVQCCSLPGEAIPRDVLLSEDETTRFSAAATNAFECIYTYTTFFRLFSPLD